MRTMGERDISLKYYMMMSDEYVCLIIFYYLQTDMGVEKEHKQVDFFLQYVWKY